MRSGSQGGFAYLLLLIGVAIIGLTSAAAVNLGATVARRSAEDQLLAVGDEFRRALHSYAASGGDAPKTLEALLPGSASPGVRRHLRKIYADPLPARPNGVSNAIPRTRSSVFTVSLGNADPARRIPHRERLVRRRESYPGLGLRSPKTENKERKGRSIMERFIRRTGVTLILLGGAFASGPGDGAGLCGRTRRGHACRALHAERALGRNVGRGRGVGCERAAILGHRGLSLARVRASLRRHRGAARATRRRQPGHQSFEFPRTSARRIRSARATRRR